jgi:hypothetical protein
VLNVRSYVTVHMTPQHQIVNSGASGIFNCSVSSSSDVHVEWFHNGKSIISNDIERSSK